MLAFSGLTKRYGDVVALDHLGFQVHPGRILGFLGPNGAGKTTAMRCVFGLVIPDSGDVTWQGAPIDRETQLRFGYMPEERGLYPKMVVGDQIAYFARLSGMDRKEAATAAAEWLYRFDLGDRSGSKLEELSHGNQQRVQLACALVHEPDVAVLDEPVERLTHFPRHQLDRPLVAGEGVVGSRSLGELGGCGASALPATLMRGIRVSISSVVMSSVCHRRGRELTSRRTTRLRIAARATLATKLRWPRGRAR